MIEEMKVNTGPTRKDSADTRQFDLEVVRGPEGSIQVMKVETNEDYSVDRINQIRSMSLNEIKTSGKFRYKQIWFNKKLDSERISFHKGSNVLIISREEAISDSMETFNVFDLRKELKVNFKNETTEDAGGMMREWFTIIMKELLNENLGIFKRSSTKNISYSINEQSQFIDNYRSLYYFTGRVIGKALFDRQPLNICLNYSLFKYLLNESISLDEMKYIDIDLFNTLMYYK